MIFLKGGFQEMIRKALQAIIEDNSDRHPLHVLVDMAFVKEEFLKEEKPETLDILLQGLIDEKIVNKKHEELAIQVSNSSDVLNSLLSPDNSDEFIFDNLVSLGLSEKYIGKKLSTFISYEFMNPLRTGMDKTVLNVVDINVFFNKNIFVQFIDNIATFVVDSNDSVILVNDYCEKEGITSNIRVSFSFLIEDRKSVV